LLFIWGSNKAKLKG